MSRWRVARRLVDPWAGLVLGALLTLAIIILLATPGPWHKAVGPVGPAPVRSPSSVDVAVFAVTGPAPGRCTAVAWVHASSAPPRVTAVLVPPSVTGAVPGGGYAPLSRLVTDLGPASATAALAGVLGVDLRGWVVVNEAALDRLFAAAVSADADRELLVRVWTARAAFAAAPHDVRGLRSQHHALARVVRLAQAADVKASAVVNYLLGSTDVRADLDLRSASFAVQSFFSPEASPVAVRTAAAIVERCGPAREWRLDEDRLDRLRRSLALGSPLPPAAPRVVTRTRVAEVIVVAGTGRAGAALADDVRAALKAHGAMPVAVRARSARGEEAGEQLAALLARRRPLAVILAPWRLPGRSVASVPPQVAVTPEQLAAMADALHRTRQPAVLVAPPSDADSELRDAALATGLPVVDVGSDGAAMTVAAPAPAYLIAAATARACWPTYLAPDLAGTRLGFSFAARRATRLGVVGKPDAGVTAWLRACGYTLAASSAGGWAPSPGTAVAYWPGTRRAAVTVAGDLGLDPSGVVRDASAPSEVTVVAPSR